MSHIATIPANFTVRCPKCFDAVNRLQHRGCVNWLLDHNRRRHEKKLTRAEAAAHVTRLVHPDHRIEFSLDEMPLNLERPRWIGML